MHRRTIFFALVLASCGSTSSKDSDSANSDTPYVVPNSQANINPGTGPGGPGSEGMEEGSPSATVESAFNRLWPQICRFDATCPEPTFEQGCDVATGASAGDFLDEQCYVVDEALVTQCEQALGSTQCRDGLQDLPFECAGAVRPCECKPGFAENWDEEGNRGCYPACDTTDDCDAGSICDFDTCVPDPNPCGPGQIRAVVDGNEGCFDSCGEDPDCGSGATCISGVCIATPEGGNNDADAGSGGGEDRDMGGL